jgi:Domain of unknown function (DUF4126)
MSEFELPLSVVLGVGLAAATGFRVFLPMLVVSAAAYFGHLPLSDSFAAPLATLAMVILFLWLMLRLVRHLFRGRPQSNIQK